VRCFFDALIKTCGDVRMMGNARIASIGPGTTEEIVAYHVQPAVTAAEAVAEGLVAELWKADTWKGKSVLIPRAEKGRDTLPAALKGWGAKVRVLAVYRTVKPMGLDESVISDIVDGKYDMMTFTSSSTFENFVALVGPASWRKMKGSLKSASIGPVTSAAMRSMGVEPTVEAREHTIAGLAKTIGEYLKHDRRI
jgi:uroporphyrinogen III methyltransferase/synthase